MLALNQPLYLNELGKRTSNQDSIYPPAGKASANDKLFLVCDGVGGSQRGDLASSLTCKYFPEYFSLNPTDSVNPTYLDNALKYTEQKLREFITQNREAALMATTLTLLHISDKGCTIAWCGDSRVYQLNKQGKIKFRTKDHSLVRTMVESGELTEEQARTHPQKNIIIKALNPGKGPTSLEAHFIPASQIEDGDYFLLCSDGIWEFIDQQFETIISSAVNNQAINNVIKKICQHQSNDNFSSYLMQLKQVADNNSATVPIPSPGATVAAPTAKPAPKKINQKLILIPVLAVFLLIVGIVLALSLGNKQEPQTSKDTEERGSSVATEIKDEPTEAKEESIKTEPVQENKNEQVTINDAESVEDIIADAKKEAALNQDKKTTSEPDENYKYASEAKSAAEKLQKAKIEQDQNKAKAAEDAKRLAAEEGARIRAEAEKKKADEANLNTQKDAAKKDEEKRKFLSIAENYLRQQYWATALSNFQKALELAPASEQTKIRENIQTCKTNIAAQEAIEYLDFVSGSWILKDAPDFKYEYVVHYIFKNSSDRPILVSFTAEGGYYTSCVDPSQSRYWKSESNQVVKEIIPSFTEKTIPVSLKNLTKGKTCALVNPGNAEKFNKKKITITFADSN